MLCVRSGLLPRQDGRQGVQEVRAWLLLCPRSASAPLPCDGGSYSSATNLTSATQCTVADPGHFSPTASADQQRCRADTYNPDSAQSSDAACISCSRNSTTDGRDGQAQISACICLPDFYEHNATSKWSTGRVDCRPCADVHETPTIAMTNCTAAGATLERLPILAGHWRQSPKSMIVRMCRDKTFCLGGDEAGDASAHTGVTHVWRTHTHVLWIVTQNV